MPHWENVRMSYVVSSIKLVAKATQIHLRCCPRFDPLGCVQIHGGGLPIIVEIAGCVFLAETRLFLQGFPVSTTFWLACSHGIAVAARQVLALTTSTRRLSRTFDFGGVTGITGGAQLRPCFVTGGILPESRRGGDEEGVPELGSSIHLRTCRAVGLSFHDDKTLGE